ncbi:MAG: DUF421 domain-containing protein [Pyrinomonadaceae bacterium]
MDEIWEQIDWLLGLSIDANKLDIGRTSLRAFIVFLIAVLLIRVGDKRFMGKHTALDVMLGIVYGSVASRAINGSAQFFPTIAACIVVVFVHWACSAIAFRSHWFGEVLKGSETTLAKSGRLDDEGMRRVDITVHDLEEAMRQHGHEANLDNLEAAYLERNGSISVIPKNTEKKTPSNQPPQAD